jgi:hypothetical protein
MRMRASRMIPVAAVAALASVLVAGPAQADDISVLTTGGVGGTNVAVDSVLTASLTSGGVAFFATASGGTSGVSCTTSTFTATVTANPTAPGTAEESVTGQTFSGCTSNVTGTTGVNSVTVTSLPMAATVASDGTVTVGSTAAPVTTTIVLTTILGSITCNFSATNGSITGVSSNTDNSIGFSNQPFTKASGSILCPTAGYFTATYAPVADATGAAVFVN